MPKVEVKNLYKIFGSNPKKIIPLLEKGKGKAEILKSTGHGVGVNNANFQVEEGEIFVVMGLSGSGKSTLIRCLNLLIRPTAGEVRIDGENIAASNKEALLKIRRKKIAMVFQNFALLPHRTVESNVEFGLEIQGVNPNTRRERAREALRLVGLEGHEDRMPSQLSGGMQQRVGLARALANDPDILLMDEAFSALDPLIRKEMQDELLALQTKMHKTIIFITHDLDEALKLGDKIAIMKDGVIVQTGTPEDILTNPADDYVREFVQDVNRVKVVTASTIMRRPDPIAYAKDGVRVAVRKMREASISSIFVVDRDRHLKGILSIDKAVDLLKAGAHEPESVKDAIDTNVETVSPDTSIETLLPLVINSKYPIVVVDEEQKVVGIIMKVSVLSGILGEDDENE
ncbi:quaternary amine ABC transporter ATP-binding protein [Caproicibacter fermentans]|uniref:Quaternary amine transport ATP-binding protein n=1 Tax=Caproicibacter fermentans TaxID=2576756 RepID=A0A7G8T750_9FIRM|nr:glycine betaine/L-proline ABC transporter ATP-binding protein [Caproicibacter fermentans]QNK39441.1 glycine betaine/L-proline ABC transporter ATP-binding protein [Caproicibacter fermentans]